MKVLVVVELVGPTLGLAVLLLSFGFREWCRFWQLDYRTKKTRWISAHCHRQAFFVGNGQIHSIVSAAILVGANPVVLIPGFLGSPIQDNLLIASSSCPFTSSCSTGVAEYSNVRHF